MTKKATFFLALLTLLMTVVACTGGNPSDPAALPTNTNSTPPTPQVSSSQQATNENQPIADSELVIYSGRSEELVGPLIERFREESGLQVSVKYGDTTELASTLLEEGANSPADVFFAQDAGALGALTNAELFAELPPDIIALVNPQYRAPEAQWVGVSARSRVVVYNTDELTEADLPTTILEYTDPKWKGRIGWAPTNASFQAFVTAMRLSLGEDVASQWLQGIQANEPRVYANNTAVLDAVGSGELSVGFINHYYLYRKLKEAGSDYPAANYFFKNGDIGGLINVAGVGILKTAQHTEAADVFVHFLLSEEAQHYFAEETEEYPLLSGIDTDTGLPALESLAAPNIDLNSLTDLQGTLELLQSLGIL